MSAAWQQQIRISSNGKWLVLVSHAWFATGSNAVVFVAFTAAFNLSPFSLAFSFSFCHALQSPVFATSFHFFSHPVFFPRISNLVRGKLLMLLLLTFRFSLCNSQALLGIRCLIFYFVHAKQFPNRSNWFSCRANKMKFFFFGRRVRV